MRGVVYKSGSGYRDQLDRAHRFLDRVQSIEPRGDIDYQDDVWAFFQNCWHIADWLWHDYRVPKVVRERAVKTAEKSRILAVCRDMANGTKHRKLTRGGRRGRPREGRAMHIWTRTTILPGGSTTIDCELRFPHRKAQFRSAREVAVECLAEWIRILKSEHLAVDHDS
jgi:hypothetical protein